MSALALDIGTYSIKAISGIPGANAGVKRVAEVFNTTGVAVPMDEASTEKLGGIIETMIKDYGFPRTDVRLSLPETVVSTKVISIPALSDAELASAIGWQAEQNIPIPPDELSLQYQVLFRPERGDKSQMRVLLVGTRKRLVDHYVEMLNNLGIEPSIIETQVLSVVRSLQFEANDPTTMIVHLGASSMNIGIVHKGELQFVLSHMNGGQLLTKTLEQSIGLDPTQAEQYKRTYGLDERQFEGKIRQALIPAVQSLTNELRKAAQFFVSQNHEGSVHRIVLSGGATALPGLVQFVTAELGTEVLVAAPFAKVATQIPDTINHPSMSVCMGLLLREL